MEFGYRYFSGNSAEQDQKLLKSFVDNHSTDPIFMFGGRGNDPAAQTEDIGRDHIKASQYGLSNLKIVADNLVDWTTDEDDDFTDLEELHGEMLGVFRRYIFHVVSMVGGVNETLLTKEQAGVPYQVVDRQEQINALSFLADHVWEPSYWL
ncbi:MAG: zinc-dependent metalloprotease, partial [Psychroflexus sp.]|nr:zinc-dependent metalloprotease [Psychroflexus sp.]